MSENTEKKGERKKVKRTRLIEQLRKDGMLFGVNTLNVPTVLIPDDQFQTNWPADSQRVADLLYAVYFDLNDEILPAAERDFILSQIREECRAGGRWFGETEAEQTERDVIVQAVMCFMNERTEFDGLTAGLLGQLRSLQLNNKIAQHEEIPAFTNIFSRRFRRLIPVLKGYGVEASLRHEEDGSYCKLVRLGTFQREPDSATTLARTADDENHQSSGQPSGGTTKKGKDFRKADAADGEPRFDNPEDKEALKARRAELAGAAEKGGAE